MYEERPRRSLLKEFIMKLILIIIFVLLLLWLVPWPNMDSYMNALNPLKDQIYNSNLQTMKDAGITYFTTERLPVKVGDKTTLSLQKMLDMKLLVPFTDRNGNSCDVKASYVSLEKKETEYLMKVNLKCGEEEDYILVHLGCYSYCDGAICEKQEKPKATPVKTKTTPKKPGPTPTIVDRYTCKFVNGQYWGKNSVVVSQSVYENECVTKPVPTPVAEKEYEYKKETSTYYAKEYSNWSEWQRHIVAKGETVTNIHDLMYEKEDLGYIKEQTGNDTVYTYVKRPVRVQVGTEKYSACKTFEYEIERTTITTETTTVTTTETVTTGGYQLVQINGQWQDTGKWYQGYNPPADSASTRYVFAGVNFNQCGDDCVHHPYVVYKQQSRPTTKYTIPASGSSSSDSSSNTSISTSISEEIKSKGCAEMVEKTIPVYINAYDIETQKVVKPVYKYVHYYRDRKRTLVHDAYTDVKIDYRWSKYDDKGLINSGYIYTGKTRDVVK